MGSLQQLSIVKGANRELKLKPIHKIFEENLFNTNSKTQNALIYGDSVDGERITTYDKLNRSANRLATYILQTIHKLNLRPNQDGDWIVAVCMTPSDNLVATLLAIWKAGASYLPIDPTFPHNRIQHIIGEARPALLIYDSYDDCAVFSGTNYVSFNELSTQSFDYNDENINDENTLTKQDGNGIAIILYTSGSTGVPKGVRLPHSIILNRLQWQWKTFPYSDSEKVGIFKTALTFVDSISEIWGPLLNGMAILVIPKEITKDPERLVAALEQFKIERLVLVPTLLRAILMYLELKSEPNLLFNLKIWVCSGEILSTTLAESFFDYFEEGTHILCNFYGSTEIMGDVTYFVCESKAQMKCFDKVPIGYPVDNTVIYILNNDLTPVKAGDTGEMFVSGLNLANGYVNGRDPQRFIVNPLAAADPKYDRLYRTGDFASIQKRGCIIYEGRTDSQIKIRGYRVDLSEIEKNVLSIDGVDKAIVLCYHAGEIDQALLSFVTLSDGAMMQQEAQLENVLKTKLADYMVPQIIIIDSVPLLVNGKIDRQSLLKMYENTNNNDDSEIVIDYDFSGIPEYKLSFAQDLFHTIGDVIGRSTRATISAQSNFYELGGNSLNSIFTVSQLRHKGYKIGITDFIKAKTLHDVLNRMNEDIVDEEFMQLAAVPLALHHKNETIEIITSSFYEKADLEQWLKPDILFTDYGDIIEEIWEPIVDKDLSFVVKDENNQIIGVALNFDARDEPELTVTSKMIIVFEFLEHIEGPIRDNQLPQGINKILHSFMMGTSSHLTAQENIAVMRFMEDEVLKLATRKRFAGILTTNTNPLTQQLGTDVFDYRALLDYQVNQYVYHDGSKPFGRAPDSQRAIVHWKEIKSEILADVQNQGSTKLPSNKSVLVLGDNSSGKTTLIAKLQGVEDPKKGSGLEYAYIDVRDEYRDDLTRLGVWVLDGDPGHSNLLKFALNESNYAHTLVILTVSMTSPWSWLDQLQNWMKVLADHVDQLKIDSDDRQESRQRLVTAWQNYCETGDHLDPSSPIKRTVRIPSVDDEDVLPLPDGAFTTNVGLDMVVVVTKTDYMTTLEKEYDYKDEHFDFMQQWIRRFCLQHGASLFYTSVKEDKNCDLLYKYLTHRIYDLPFRTPALVVEKDAVLIPSGWDNMNKISILHENMQTCKPDDYYTDVIMAPPTRKTVSNREVEVQTEDEQAFLARQQQLLMQGQSPSSRGESPMRTPSGPKSTPRAPIDGNLKSGTPGGEGVLANFFNSLLNKKAGSPGSSPNAAASPRSLNGTVDISDKTAMRSDAAAELDRLTRNVKKEMDFTQTDC